MVYVEFGVLEAGLVFLAGVATGFVNTLAGGGSLIAISALIFLGLPSPIANATNRVGIVFQGATGTWRYRRSGRLRLGEAVSAAVPAGLGAIVGVSLAVEVSERVFDVALGVVLVLVIATVFIPAPVGSEGRFATLRNAWSIRYPRTMAILRFAVFFVVGVYGGFVQAGVGFLLITAITFTMGHDLVTTNGIKVLVILVFATISLVVFSAHGMVAWVAGLLLALGTTAGSWIGVHASVKGGAGFIRWVVVLAAGAAAVRLFL